MPAYTMAPHSEKLKMMRVVVREDFSRGRCDALVKDFKMIMDEMKHVDPKTHEEHRKATAKKQSKVPKSSGQSIEKGHHKDDHSLQGQHEKSHPIC